MTSLFKLINNTSKFLAVSFALMSITSCKQSDPHLTVVNKDINIGILKPGEKRNSIFILKNEGGSPLVIKSIKAGCRCTQLKLNTDTINPGQSAKLNVEYYASTQIAKEETFRTPVVLRTNSKKVFEQLTVNGIVRND